MRPKQAKKNTILDQLNRSETEEGICFSYTALDRSQIYNASLLGASLLAQVASIGTEHSCFLQPARQATLFVLNSQNPDGSWYYGRAPHHQWVDGHHTGFILRELAEIHATTGWAEIEQPLKRGLDYYASQLIEPDGRPKNFFEGLLKNVPTPFFFQPLFVETVKDF